MGESPFNFLAGAVFGLLFGGLAALFSIPGASDSCRDDRDVERLCIDGNDNACRVMEARRRG